MTPPRQNLRITPRRGLTHPSNRNIHKRESAGLGVGEGTVSGSAGCFRAAGAGAADPAHTRRCLGAPPHGDRHRLGSVSARSPESPWTRAPTTAAPLSRSCPSASRAAVRSRSGIMWCSIWTRSRCFGTTGRADAGVGARSGVRARGDTSCPVPTPSGLEGPAMHLTQRRPLPTRLCPH